MSSGGRFDWGRTFGGAMSVGLGGIIGLVLGVVAGWLGYNLIFITPRGEEFTPKGLVFGLLIGPVGAIIGAVAARFWFGRWSRK